MAKLKDKDGKSVQFVMVPLILIRSARLDPYDKVIYALIAGCNPSFPSYSKLREWAGISESRLIKSLKNLEAAGIIKRYPTKTGRSIQYVTYWDDGTRHKVANIEQREIKRFQKSEKTNTPPKKVTTPLRVVVEKFDFGTQHTSPKWVFEFERFMKLDS